MSVMQKRIMLLAIVSLITLGTTARGATVVEAVRADQRPSTNGRLDEECWKKAKPVMDFMVLNTDQPAKFKTTAYVLYDDNAIYFGFRCEEPEIKSIVTEKCERDGKAPSHDCVEIMLDPACSGNEYFHFVVDASGSIYDEKRAQGGFVGEIGWDGEWEAASFIGDGFWSCEVVIPFYNFGISPKVTNSWRVNMCREKKKPEENSSIAEKGIFNSAPGFAQLKGLDVDFTPYCYTLGDAAVETTVKDNALAVRVSVPVENKTGRDAAVRIESTLVAPSRKTHLSSAPAAIKNGERQVCPAGEFVLAEQGRYACFVSVADPKTKQLRALAVSRLQVEYVPMAINLIAPWYRYAIFESQKLKDVVFDVEMRLKPEELKDAKLIVSIREAGSAKDAVSRTFKKNIKPPIRVEFPVDKLPYGKLEIAAVLSGADGKQLAETKLPIKKLPHKDGEVWRGEDGNWYVDGKQFFINAVWGHPQDYDPYINALINMPTGTTATALMEISGRTGFGHTPTFYEKIQKGIFEGEVRDTFTTRVREAKDKPRLLGHYVWDEPDCQGIPTKVMEDIYNLMVEEDPYHPVFYSTGGSLTGIRNYANCFDINGRHCYPRMDRDKRVNDLSKVVIVMEDLPAVMKGRYHKHTTTWMHQGFNYGDVNELNARIPSYVELRDENIVALILGSKGFMGFDVRVPYYPELYVGLPHLHKEFMCFAPAVLAPEAGVKAVSSSPTMKLLLKDVKGELWLFVSNAQNDPVKATIIIPGIGKKAKRLTVISEDRTVALDGDSFSDSFDTWEARVYTTSQEKRDLITIKEICRLIEEEYNKRAKPGNLAFQRYEDTKVSLSASSNQSGRRADNGLWHVTDGQCDPPFRGVDNIKEFVWHGHDMLKDKTPDWIELRFKKEIPPIGKVVVYAYEKGLKDYTVQAFVNNEWKDVDKVTGKSEGCITHVFPPVKTDRIRILVTAVNGSCAKIAEIEVYEK